MKFPSSYTLPILNLAKKGRKTHSMTTRSGVSARQGDGLLPKPAAANKVVSEPIGRDEAGTSEQSMEMSANRRSEEVHLESMVERIL